MRRQSRVKVKARGVTIGGADPLVCLPLLAATVDELPGRAAELVALGPDILEWRVDAMEGIDVGQVVALLRRLRQVIGELPPHYRLITLLRHDQQLSYEEIATILDCPLGTVKARIHRARAMILQRLKEKSYDI